MTASRRATRLREQPCAAAAAGDLPPGARSVEFTATTELGGGVKLRGTFFEPDGTEAKVPCLVMAHGFASTYHMSLMVTARAYREAGFAVLAFDHRSTGESDGEPRSQVDFWAQIAGYKDVRRL